MGSIKANLGVELEKKGAKLSVDSIFGADKVVGLYFSAHWCPPCRGFTPVLIDWYNKIKAGPKGDKLEVVFISSDRDAASFKEYYDSMPWAALPFGDQERKNKISSMYGVRGIPTFVLLYGEDGADVNRDGRMLVMNDEDGEDFPYK